MGPTGVTEPGRIGLIEVVAGIEHLIAEKAVDVAVELVRTRLRGDQNATRGTLAIECAVVSGEDLHLLDGVDAWIDDQRFTLPTAGIDTRVKDIAAIDRESVVLHAATVHAELRTARDANLCLILSGLITDPGGHRNEL